MYYYPAQDMGPSFCLLLKLIVLKLAFTIDEMKANEEHFNFENT